MVLQTAVGRVLRDKVVSMTELTLRVRDVERLCRVGPGVAHEVASGVRDLHQDSSHKLLRVDPLVFPWLPSAMSALAGVEDLLRA